MNTQLSNIALSDLSNQQLGWTPFFQQSLMTDFPDWYQFTLARVFAQHRSHLEVVCAEIGVKRITVQTDVSDITVGDWLLLDADDRIVHLLERRSLFARKAAGTKVALQLIAANVDTLFVVCSLNQNFNLNRIERYLALAKEAQVEPVVVLTKADCCIDAYQYIEQVQKLDSLLMIEAVNGLDSDSVAPLLHWAKTGKTIAFVGSSGVGKSTLINTMMNEDTQHTHAAREDDDRGRHTTTGRSLHVMPSGALLLDTPGMRELQLADCEDGVNQTFADITSLSEQCQFSDCSHQNEPKCAVQQAIHNGELDARRLVNYQKLMREQARNSASLAERRQNDKALHKHYKRYIQAAQKNKGRI